MSISTTQKPTTRRTAGIRVCPQGVHCGPAAGTGCTCRCAADGFAGTAAHGSPRSGGDR